MLNFFCKKIIDETLEEQRQDLMRFPESHRQEFLDGEDCDVVSNADGEFGRSVTNPIPVNGPAGEIKYLNRMNKKRGRSLIYHRLGSIVASNLDRSIDVFEVVEVGGKYWDILYLDMYHPRRSTKTPEGYIFSKFHKIFSRLPVGYGSTKRDITFPFGIGDLIEKDIHVGSTIFAKRLAKHYREIVNDRNEYIRPKEHEEKLKIILSTLSPTSYYGVDIKFP